MYKSDLDHYTVEPVITVTNLAVLMGDRINEGFFFTRKCMAILPGSQKEML